MQWSITVYHWLTVCSGAYLGLLRAGVSEQVGVCLLPLLHPLLLNEQSLHNLHPSVRVRRLVGPETHSHSQVWDRVI